MAVRTDLEHARELSREDDLAAFRERFVVADPGLVYLDGNSLGRLPRATLARADALVRDEWGERLVGGWNAGWFDLSERIGAKIAPLIGAQGDEVILADSTSVNLFKLVVAALRSRPDRASLVTDDLNFPSDLYVLESAVRLAGLGQRLEIVASRDGVSMPIESLAAAIGSDTALVALSHATFKSGFVYDLEAVTDLAHRVGALMLWDLSHSAGAMPIDLRDASADLAVGCTYKYLNGGPGAPAFLYVRDTLQQELENPIAGWFGHEDPFGFEPGYRPAAGVRRFLTGTPPVLSTALVEPGVDLLLEAGLERVRRKSVRQTEYLIGLWESLLAPLGYSLASPRSPDRRASHVSLRHPEGMRIARALIDRMRVVPDFRHPDTIRLGVAPLYTSFEEIHKAVMALHAVVVERLYEHYPADRRGVT